MSKSEAKLDGQNSAVKPDTITKDAELSDEQLNDVSGGFLGFRYHPTDTPKTTKPTGGGGLHVRKAGENPSDY